MSEGMIGMGNPAEEFCLLRGGDVVCGGLPEEEGLCLCRFPDGSECELWDYFRGVCTPTPTASVPVEPKAPPTLTKDMSMLLFAGLGMLSLVLLNRTGKRKK